MTDQEAFREVERRIAMSLREGALELNLGFFRLTRLPESLGQLRQLEQLYIWGNQLTALPESLGQLPMLQYLNLSDNRLPTLPESLGQSGLLQYLDVSNNQLTALPQGLGQLKLLQLLNLSHNRLASLPETVGQLKELQVLNMSHNQLRSLPESMRELTGLKQLYLHGNPALGLPDEVLGPTWKDSGKDKPPKPAREILDYYFSTRGAAGRPLNELRLIVVGRPKAGKTTLVRRLRRLPMNPAEPETHGIDIQALELACPGGKLLARIWDFGGQHVLHAMHEMFLRQRCLYLLVVEQRTNDVERDLTYWLQLVRSYAGDAPVVVALNQSKGIARSLARAALERDYGPIAAWVPTECAPEHEVGGANATIEELRRALTEAAAAMPEPRKLFPGKWLEIKIWLEQMKEPYLDYAAYAKRCAELHENDPEKQAALAAAMDELGVALNFARDPRLHDTTVLRPNWLANGIHSLLRANILTTRPLVPDAILTAERVGEILAAAGKRNVLKEDEYPCEKWPFLLRLMALFQLTFTLDEAGLNHFCPALLPADEPPDCPEPMEENAARLRYEFDVVPGPLMGRLLVRLFPLIEDRKAWQRGASLRQATARARVWVDLEDKYVFATVGGSDRDRARLLEKIRETLKKMFAEYTRLRVVEQWWHDDAWVPRRTLEKFKVLPPDKEIEPVPEIKKRK